MWAANSSHSIQKGNRDPAFAPWLSTVSYRSRATTPLSDDDLEELVSVAQARNRAESITGMVMYDDGQFLQWLEGPTDALSRVMNSIAHDTRHTNIEILGKEKTPVRMFDGWHLKLKKKPAKFVIAPLGFKVAEAREIAPAVVICDADSRAMAHDNYPRASELARLLIAPDATNASRLIDQLAAQAGSPRELFVSLFEPTARSLGDLWSEDHCTEFDLTIGLSHLQTAMRRINYTFVRAPVIQCDAGTVLVTPQPGEPHILGAALNSEILWQAGWNPRCEFPATDDALQEYLANDWFDALDLSLSISFRREHWLPRVAKTISGARSASCNPAIAVVISGRLFKEQPDLAAYVGADARTDSCIDVAAVMSRAVSIS